MPPLEIPPAGWVCSRGHGPYATYEEALDCQHCVDEDYPDRPSFAGMLILASLWAVAFFWLPLGLLIWWLA